MTRRAVSHQLQIKIDKDDTHPHLQAYLCWIYETVSILLFPCIGAKPVVRIGLSDLGAIIRVAKFRAATTIDNAAPQNLAPTQNSSTSSAEFANTTSFCNY